MAQSEIEKLRKRIISLEKRLLEKEQRILESGDPRWEIILKFLGNSYFQAVAVFIALAVALSGKLDILGASVAVVVAFGIGGIGIYTHCSRTSPKKLLAVALILVYALLLWNLHRYLVYKDGPLTQQQKETFTKALRSYGLVPDYIQLACPEADERACIYATSFIPLFQRAGWMVEGPVVQRVKLAQPTDKIVMVNFGPPKVDPQNPDQGVWTKISVWQAPLKMAFGLIDIKPEEWNDPSMPIGKCRVYFGSAPQR